MKDTMRRLDEKIEKSSHYINQTFYNLFEGWGLNENVNKIITIIILILATALLTYIVHYITRRIIRFVLRVFVKQHFALHLRRNHFAFYTAQIAPLAVIDYMIVVIFENNSKYISFFNLLFEIYSIFLFINIVVSVIKSFGDKFRDNEKYNHRPISSYIQVIQIILYFFALILSFSKLTGKDPLTFFSIMGAASAILLLMFKDTIMGFVASIQVTIHDMVRIGDWIEMPKYGADGDVIEINLTTVKVQNWDKTITTLPTHTLISDSFKNWRGMKEFGGRRLKRSLIIKQASIKFISEDELPKYKMIQGIREYIDSKKDEIDEHNKRIHADRNLAINGRNLTNAGLFRRYATWYINNHPGVHKQKTMLVRQMTPTENGLPFEIYFFTNTTVWTEYESIVSDIFDHLIASISYFGLEIFENPTGFDFEKINH